MFNNVLSLKCAYSNVRKRNAPNHQVLFGKSFPKCRHTTLTRFPLSHLVTLRSCENTKSRRRSIHHNFQNKNRSGKRCRRRMRRNRSKHTVCPRSADGGLSYYPAYLLSACSLGSSWGCVHIKEKYCRLGLL